MVVLKTKMQINSSKYIRDKLQHNKYFIGRGANYSYEPFWKESLNLDAIQVKDSFNWIYSHYYLQCQDDIEDIIWKWHSQLVDNGYLFIVVPDYELYEKKQWPSIFVNEHEHQCSFSMNVRRSLTDRDSHYNIEQDLIPILNNAGFKVIDYGLEFYKYDRSMDSSIDQTCLGALCQIRIICQKVRPAVAPVKKRRQVKILSLLGYGLGDHLAMSTLPKLYFDKGFDVYVQDRFVSDEVKNLITKDNPYVKGTTLKKVVNYNYKYRGQSSFIKNIEVDMGFPGTNEYPVIYYKPNILSEFSDKVLVDFQNRSAPYNRELTLEALYKFLNEYDKEILEIVTPGKFNKITTKYEKLNIDLNIKYYCDLINSCYMFITLNSGGMHLASAIKQSRDMPKIMTFISGDCGGFSEISKSWYQTNVNYIRVEDYVKVQE